MRAGRCNPPKKISRLPLNASEAAFSLLFRFPLVLYGILGGANKGLGEAPKSCTRKEYESANNSIARGVKGQLPLQGSRDSVPCGGWGNAPTVPRATSIANALNKGAGSEASLPLTSRVLRRALKLLFPQDSVKNLSFSAQCREFRPLRHFFVKKLAPPNFFA